MSVTRAQKARLGIFVMSGLVVLAGGLVVLAGMKLGEARDTYLIKYDDGAVSLSGLDVGSPVKYSGIAVGRVDQIRIDPGNVGVILVRISLVGSTPVAEDSVANLGSMGITGLKYIELSRGSADARVRAPGEDIPAGKSALDDLSNQAGEIAAKVNTAIAQLNAITAPEMKDRLARVLDNTERLLATAEGTLAENRESIKRLVTNLSAASVKFESLADHLASTAGGADALIGDAAPRLRRTLDSAASAARNLERASRRVDGLLEKMDGVMANARALTGPEGLMQTKSRVERLLDRGNLLVMQSRENLVESLSYLRETAENLTEFSRKVREDPSLLLISEDDGEPE